MTQKSGSGRERPPRPRLLDEETEAEKYKRQGWDPRKTYAENMGFEGVLDRPGEEFDPTGRYENDGAPTREVEELAALGRGEDTEIAHVARGEYVIPRFLQTPELLAVLRHAAAEQGIPFDSLRVGSARNSLNPNTGAPEFGVMDEEDPERISAQQTPYRYEGPEIDEITVTTPIEHGRVQLPQNLPNSGFYNYGTPEDGAAQYGLPSTIGLIAETGSRWLASGAAPFGVGNMSLADGSQYEPHKSAAHQNGTGFDMRPIRRDGKPTLVNINDPNYDREATQRLVDTLRATGGVKKIFFGDRRIKGTTYLDGHDNHLHIEVDPSWTRR